MKTITIDGKPCNLAPLPYGVLRRNKEVVDAYTTSVETDTVFEVTDKAMALLHLSTGEADLTSLSPGEIAYGAAEVFRATFARPEESAPALSNPSTGAL